MGTNGQKFYDAHPWAAMDLAEELEAQFDGKIPYCDDCNDWHHPNQQHSLKEEVAK